MIRRAHSQAERQKVLDTAQLLQERPQLAGSGPSPRRRLPVWSRTWAALPARHHSTGSNDQPGPDPGDGEPHGKAVLETAYFRCAAGRFRPNFIPTIGSRRVPALPSPFRPTCGVDLRPGRTNRESSGPTGTDRYRRHPPRNVLFSESPQVWEGRERVLAQPRSASAEAARRAIVPYP